MSAPRPSWAGEYGPSYEQIVRSWDYEVAEFETFGSYQGDHLALLHRAGEIGLIVFGYGSCSGCDELGAISPWDDDEDWQPVIDFAANLKRDVHWEPTAADLRNWVDAHPENHWWSWDDEISAWLNEHLGTSLKADS